MVTIAYLPSFDELIAVLQQGKMTVEDAQKVHLTVAKFSVVKTFYYVGNRELY